MLTFYDFGGGTTPGLYGDHAYWRLFATNNNGNASFITLAEMVFKNGAGSTIPTSGGSVISGPSTWTTPGNLFDGNNGTTGNAQNGSVTNQYVGYHFASAVGVEQITLTLPSSNPNQSPKDCKLQYSDDGSAWSDAFSFSMADYVAGQTRTVPETLAAGFHRGFRLFCIDNNGGSAFIVLDELQLRATAGGADQTANVGSGQGTSSGRVTRSSEGVGNEGYRVFDNTTATANYWATGTNANEWVAFYFPNPVKVEEVALTSPNTSATRCPKDMLLQYTDDGGATWTTQKTFASQTGWGTNETRVLAAI